LLQQVYYFFPLDRPVVPDSLRRSTRSSSINGLVAASLLLRSESLITLRIVLARVAHLKPI
jgi:hypothetical protein